jgi:hypothetical protein
LHQAPVHQTRIPSVDETGGATDEERRAHDSARFAWFIPNYLAALIPAGASVCSVGCGTGVDVEMLRRLGIDARGCDPGYRVKFFDERPAEVRQYLVRGAAEDMPFGEMKFDLVYSLEVIEHVGCVDFGWRVTDQTERIRRDYIAACLSMLKPKGSLIITSGNRICFLDPGHKIHHYSRVTRLFAEKLHIPLTIPWSKRNLLPSFGDIKRLVAQTPFGGRVRFEALPTANAVKMCGRDDWKGFVARNALRIASWGPLRLSPISPVLIVRLTLDGRDAHCAAVGGPASSWPRSTI